MSSLFYEQGQTGEVSDKKCSEQHHPPGEKHQENEEKYGETTRKS